MATFTAEIEKYAGSAIGYADEISGWLDDGVRDIVTKSIIKYPETIDTFTRTFRNNDFNDVTEGYFNSTGEWFYIYKIPLIVSMFRSDGTDMHEVKEIPLTLKHKAGNTNSIYNATDTSPVYYKETGVIKTIPESNIFPNILEVNAVVFGDVSDSSVSVTNFPEFNYPYLTYYAAINLIYAKMLAMNTAYTADGNSIDTDIESIQEYITSFVGKFSNELAAGDTLSINEAFSALNKAKQYLDDWGGVSDEFGFEKLVEEDEVEMASTVLSGVQSNLAIAGAYLSDVTSKVGMASNYIQTIQPIIAKINQKTAKDNTVYQWLIGQLTFLKEKYMAKFG